jgi:hypothetical protein
MAADVERQGLPEACARTVSKLEAARPKAVAASRRGVGTAAAGPPTSRPKEGR